MLKVLAFGGVGTLAAACAAPAAPAQQVEVTREVPKEVEVVVTATPSQKAPVEIDYWQAPIWRMGKDNKTPNAPIDEWINHSIELFEAANPDVKVRLELIPWDTWGAKTSTAIASGTLPNLLYGAPQPNQVLVGLYDPIDEFVTEEDKANWSPARLAASTLFGRIYGIPTFSNPNMFAVSKTALEKHGGAEFIPNDEMRGLTIQSLEKMSEAFGDGSTRYAIGVPVGDSPSAVYFDFAHAMIGRGVMMWDEGFERFIAHENPRSVEALKWFVDAQKNGWMIPNLPKSGDVNTFYWNQNCAARGQWPGIQTELETAQAAGQAGTPFEIVLCSHPYDENLTPHAAGVDGGGAFGVGKTSDAGKREAAYRLGNWYATEPSVGESWLVNGFFPTSKTQMKSVEGHPLLQDPNKRWVLDTYLTKYKPEPLQGHPMFVQNARTAKILGDIKVIDYSPSGYILRNFQNLLLGQTTPEQMMQEMATTINTALGVPV
jgi:ABC-type glycerol-3-phosphate transport system substrate-binding protein